MKNIVKRWLAALPLGVCAMVACGTVVTEPLEQKPATGTASYQACKFTVDPFSGTDPSNPPYKWPNECPASESDRCFSEGPVGFTEPYDGGAMPCAPDYFCQSSCESDDDCPLPGTGDATPQCWENKCWLSCSDGTACPDGMVCRSLLYTSGGPISQTCVWRYDGDCSVP